MRIPYLMDRAKESTYQSPEFGERREDGGSEHAVLDKINEAFFVTVGQILKRVMSSQNLYDLISKENQNELISETAVAKALLVAMTQYSIDMRKEFDKVSREFSELYDIQPEEPAAVTDIDMVRIMDEPKQDPYADFLMNEITMKEKVIETLTEQHEKLRKENQQIESEQQGGLQVESQLFDEIHRITEGLDKIEQKSK